MAEEKKSARQGESGAQTADANDYERDKASYEVLDYYDNPVWYKKWFIWLWPTIIIYIFLIAVSAPEDRTYTVLSFGAALAGFHLLSVCMRKFWPI